MSGDTYNRSRANQFKRSHEPVPFEIEIRERREEGLVVVCNDILLRAIKNGVDSHKTLNRIIEIREQHTGETYFKTDPNPKQYPPIEKDENKLIAYLLTELHPTNVGSVKIRSHSMGLNDLYGRRRIPTVNVVSPDHPKDEANLSYNERNNEILLWYLLADFKRQYSGEIKKRVNPKREFDPSEADYLTHWHDITLLDLANAALQAKE